jgi:tetratricopeptide (TPR) repeat protein
MAAALNNLGIVAIDRGDFVQAATLLDEALTLRRAIGDKRGIASSLENLGMVMRSRGDDDRAVALYHESLALFQEIGDNTSQAILLINLGDALRKQGDHASAVTLYHESLALHGAAQTFGVASCLEGLAAIAGALGAPQRAARLWGAAAALRDALGTPLPPADRPDHDGAVAAARTAMGEAAFAAAWAQGQEMSLEQTIAEARVPLDPS